MTVLMTKQADTVDSDNWIKKLQENLTFDLTTVCVQDCGLHNQNIDKIILLVCLVGWFNSSPSRN